MVIDHSFPKDEDEFTIAVVIVSKHKCMPFIRKKEAVALSNQKFIIPVKTSSRYLMALQCAEI